VHLAWWYARRAEEDWAISEIVYLDTDRDAVPNGDARVKIGESEVSMDLSELDVQDLIPGSTYYWRVDEVYADGQVIAGYIWQFSLVSKKATAPQPADGTLYADPIIVLSWTAGLGATSHAVHIGTDQAAVANAATADGVTVTEPNYSPDPLAADTTYYWRVDEIGAGGTFVGDVWSLTVGPDIPVTDPNLVGYWKLDETPDDHIIDASGHHHHGLLVGGPTLVDDVAGGKALEFNGQNQFCKLGNWLPSQNQLTVALRVKWAGSTGASQGLIAKRNTWTNSMWTLWAQENGQIAFETFKNTLLSETMAVDTWEHWAVTHDNGQTVIYRDGLQVASGAQPSFGNQPTANLVLGAMEFIGDTGRNPFNGALDDVRLYNKVLTAAEIQQLSRIDLLQAWDPTPASGSASNLVLGQNTVLLSWQPGDKAAQHKVLFGSEPNALAELGTVTETSIASPVVDVNSTYFWKVDEINTDGTVTEGAVWSFTTANFLIIDDMEAYNDLDPADPLSNRIFNAWIDGYDDPTNGSLVGNDMPPFAEQTIVHGGNQSMPMFYDNSAAAKSEATLTLTSSRDWTIKGVDTLTIWYIGGSSNAAEQMYVTLNGTAKVDNDNPDAATTTSWTPWNIPLQAFADQGVNLTNVNSIALGLSSVTGGTGTMYFDDIRLHPPTQ
jgi:hypothetical protein